MDLTDSVRQTAEAHLQDDLRGYAKAVRACYDNLTSRVVVELDNGLELAFPPRLVEGLTPATASQLSSIEITPLGDGLHWPELDADLYVPGLLTGIFGTKRWMAENQQVVSSKPTGTGSRRKQSQA